MGAPKAPGDEAKHHIMRLGAHILHPPPLKPNLHPLLAFGGVPTCVLHRYLRRFANHINFAPTHVVIFFGKFSNYSAMIFQSLYSQCSDWKIIALFLKSAPFAAFLHNIIFFTKMIMIHFRCFNILN